MFMPLTIHRFKINARFSILILALLVDVGCLMALAYFISSQLMQTAGYSDFIFNTVFDADKFSFNKKGTAFSFIAVLLSLFGVYMISLLVCFERMAHKLRIPH